MLRRAQLGIAAEHLRGGGDGRRIERFVAHRVRDLERRFAMLRFAEQVAHAAAAQVLPRDLEAIVRLDEQPQALVRVGPDVAEEDAPARVRAAPHAPAELMQLRESEALGMLDDHHRRVRHVDADLDHRRRDEHIDRAVAESAHGLVALGEKGKRPDVLLLSATPIPRSLALTVYGDLDVSTIDERPPGRVPVRTAWRTNKSRADVLAFLDAEIAKGRQAYIVYPVIEESETRDLKAATTMFKDLSGSNVAVTRDASCSINRVTSDWS